MLFYHSITAPSVFFFFFFFWQKVANTPGNSRAKKEKGSTELEKNDSNANQEKESERKQITQPKNTQCLPCLFRWGALSLAEVCLLGLVRHHTPVGLEFCIHHQTLSARGGPALHTQGMAGSVLCPFTTSETRQDS